MFLPKIFAEPDVGKIKLLRLYRSDFPAPLGPIKPYIPLDLFLPILFIPLFFHSFG